MFDRILAPLLSAPLGRMPTRMSRRISSPLLPIGVAIVLAASASLAGTTPAMANPAGAAATTEPSIQYQEAVAHAGDTFVFPQGGVVNVPFRPRAGDSSTVDGAAPIPLPAGQGSGVATPSATAPGPVTPNGTSSTLRREVFGFLPSWELGTTLDYDSLSTIAYFGIDLDQNDGSLHTSDSDWANWRSSTMTTIINTAHLHGTRVELTVESMAWDTNGATAQTTLLSNPTASLNAARQIAAEIGSRGADGVNLDFEPIASGQKANYTAFVRMLRTELDKVHPGYELTFCANGMPSSYDLTGLTNPGAADAVFIMGYDFRGGSPATTGSIDPLISSSAYDLGNAVDAFKAQVPVSKIILGLPFYGKAWSTGTSTGQNAVPVDPNVYGQPAAVYYSTAAPLAATVDGTHLGRKYDTVEQSAWTAYFGTYGGSPTWRELYFDDAQSLGVRLDAIDGWNLRGVGIWALGYDNNGGNGDLTHAIATHMETGGSTFAPITPVRLLDTRANNGLPGRLSAGVPSTFQVSGRGGVPANATAVTGNLTVVGETSGWAVYLGPDANPAPTTSSINFVQGDIVSQGLTVALSAAGTLSATYISNAGNATDLVFDVTGYFVPDTSGATYLPLNPVRLLDTRAGNGLSGVLTAGTPRTFQVAGRGGVPANAIAVTGNLTVVDATMSWAVALGPVATSSPTTSTINFSTRQIIANGLTVGLSSAGTLSATYLSKPGNTTNLVFDVSGYFVPGSSGAKFLPIAAARPVDTRISGGPLSAGVPRTFQVTGGDGVPASATAITGHITVVLPTGPWAAFVGPVATASPSTSSLNFLAGQIRDNGLTMTLGSGGTLSATYMSTSGNTTDLVVDVTGYYAP
jgi:spore germination protein YaaH